MIAAALHPLLTMAELTAEEKKRILRERRQAKMGQGKALERLNLIFGLGLLVKADKVTLVLDKPTQPPQPQAQATGIHTPPQPPLAQFTSPITSTTPNILSGDDDPEVVDISRFDSGAPPPENPDDMLQQLMLRVAGYNGENSGGGGDDMLKMFAAMMKGEMPDIGGNFANQQPLPLALPEEIEYQAKLGEYHAYQAKKTKFIFLIVRYIAVLANFGYHFYHYRYDGFSAAQTDRVRHEWDHADILGFFQVFVAVEVVIMLAWYVVLRNHHLRGDSGIIMKGLNAVLMFVPQVDRYRRYIAQAMGYWLVLGVFFGDLSLVVVLFGLLSCV